MATAERTIWRDEASVEIDADPARVWVLVSDVARMGEWSPVCRRVEYLDGATSPAEGVRFVGHNRQFGARWSRTCVVTTFVPEQELAFHTLFRDAVGTRWRYRLEPWNGCTRVVESYELVSMPRWVAAMHRLPGMTSRMRRETNRGMQRTLSHIRAVAESGHDPV
jgi:hypothetical protein